MSQIDKIIYIPLLFWFIILIICLYFFIISYFLRYFLVLLKWRLLLYKILCKSIFIENYFNTFYFIKKNVSLNKCNLSYFNMYILYLLNVGSKIKISKH